MDSDALGKFFSWQLAAWAAFLVNLVAVWRVLPLVMQRLNERRRDVAAERDRDVELIRNERDLAREEREMTLDKRAEERERWAIEKAALTEEIATLKGFQLGIGMGRNEATSILAAERIAQNGKPSGGNGGGE